MRASSIRNVVKNCLLLTIISVVIWFMIRPSTHVSKKHFVNVNQWTAHAVWDFVADINHLKITNPFLEEFDIVSDGGVYPDWHYSAILKENIPVLGRVESNAECLVKNLGTKYQIITIYKHCRIFLCVHVNSTLTFISKDSGTIVTEDLGFLFPNILVWFFDAPAIVESHVKRINVIKSHLEKNMFPSKPNAIYKEL